MMAKIDVTAECQCGQKSRFLAEPIDNGHFDIVAVPQCVKCSRPKFGAFIRMEFPKAKIRKVA